jgi:hypothetical protein
VKNASIPEKREIFSIITRAYIEVTRIGTDVAVPIYERRKEPLRKLD